MQLEHCQKCVVEAGWTDLTGTLVQAIFRSLLGWMSGSLGLVVQGLYSFGDALAKGINLVSVRIAQRPPSKTFPFGSGKILFVSSLIIGAGLLFGGVSLGITSFTDIEGIQSVPSLVTVLGIVLSAFASELMHRFLKCVAKENNNSAIQSAAWDNRVDAFSSGMVLVGVFLSNIGIPAADHVSAFIVSLMVMRIGSMIAWDAVKGLLDVTVSQEALADMARTSRKTQGVLDVKLIRGRSLGEYWEIYLHIAIDENLSVREGHEIVENLRRRVQTDFPRVQHIWIVTVPQKSRDEEGTNYWKEHLFSIPRGEMTANPPSPEVFGEDSK